MSKVTVQATINPELKKQAEAVFAALGLSTADAIRLFLQQTVNVGGLPFQPMVKRPNADTLEAMLCRCVVSCLIGRPLSIQVVC